MGLCKECKKQIKRSIFRSALKYFFSSLIAVMSVIGILGVYNFAVGDVYSNPDLMFTLGGAYSFVENFRSQFQSNNEIRQISKNITSKCNPEDKECKAKDIFDNLTAFKYEVGTDLDPLKIWNDKEGDCDEMSYLYLSLLKAEGIKSWMQCSSNHCWNIIYLDDKQIFADIVNDEWKTE